MKITGCEVFLVALPNRSEPTLQPFRECRGIRHQGVLGEGVVVPAFGVDHGHGKTSVGRFAAER